MKNLKRIQSEFKKSSPMPILETGKIENGAITFTDLETSIIIKDFCNTDIIGCVNGQSLVKAIESIEGYKLEQTEDKIVVKNESEKVNLSFNTIEDYPNINLGVANLIGYLTKTDLDHIYTGVKFIDRSNSNRFEIEHVYINHSIVSTNVHYMYFEKTEGIIEGEVLLNEKTIKLLKICNPSEIEIQNVTYDKKVTSYKITFDNIEIYQRKICDKYANWEGVMPVTSDLDSSITLPNAFKDAAKKALTFAAGQQIELNTKDGLTIYSNDINHGLDYSKSFHINSDGFLRVAFNGSYLNAVLNEIEGDITIKQFGANTRAHLINHNFLLMPVQLKD